MSLYTTIFHYLMFPFELEYSFNNINSFESLSIKGNNINDFIFIINNSTINTYRHKVMKIINDGGYRKSYDCPLCRQETCFLANIRYLRDISLIKQNTYTCPICLDDINNNTNILLKTECCKQHFCYDCLKTYSLVKGIYKIWTDKVKDDLDLLIYNYNVFNDILEFIKNLKCNNNENKFIWNQIFVIISLPLAHYFSIYYDYYINSEIELEIFFVSKFIYISFEIGNIRNDNSENSKYLYRWINTFTEEIPSINLI